MNDERLMMKNDDFRLLKGFASEQTDRRMDICECRVAFATENDMFKAELLIYKTHIL